MPVSFNILALDPGADAQDVSPSSAVLVAINFLGFGMLTQFQVLIDDVVAFTYTPPATSVFPYPDFSGTFTNVGGYLSALIRPRRQFLPGATVKVSILVTSSPLILFHPSTEQVDNYFHVAVQAQPLLDTSLQRTRVDAPFPETVALELLRQQMLSALRPRITSVSAVQLFYRVNNSQLAAMSMLMGLPRTVAAEAARVLPEDVAPINSAAAVADQFMPLFEPALHELRGLGVDEADLSVLRRASTAQYPQDRLGAMCAALLLASRQFSAIEARPPGPGEPV